MTVGGGQVVVDTRKALAIVALVAGEGRPFARDELAAMFWPEADDEAARGALRRTLSALRSAVDGPGLLIERTRVALDPAAASVDLAELESLAGSDRRQDLEAAALLARGPFLAGFALRDSPAFDDWQALSKCPRRTDARRPVRPAGARSGRGWRRAGAIEAARRRVELDPLDEPGQRRLIELLAETDDRSGAIRQYRSLVALFDRELGVAPLRETTDLYESIREEATPAPAPVPVASVEVAPAIDAGMRPSARPLPFVGRDRELTEILATARDASPDGRLVLIEGEAGIGKTRLAEVATDSIRDRGGLVLASRAYPGEDAIAFGPIADLLRGGLATPNGVAGLTALDPVALGEVGRLVDLPTSLRATARPVTMTGDYAQVRLLDAIADALTALVLGPGPGRGLDR